MPDQAMLLKHSFVHVYTVRVLGSICEFCLQAVALRAGPRVRAT